jgi:N-acetylneuraminate synthase
MKRIKIGEKKIGKDNPVFVIAEAGSNHNNKLEQAKKLIDIASNAGADAIKFQLFKAEKIYPKTCGFVDTPMGKIDFFEVLKKTELPLDWLEILKEYSEKKNLLFLCSCFDEESADALEDVDIQAHKLGSPELNHIPLLEHLAKKNKPLILSTGLSKLDEVQEAVDACERMNNGQLILLHCISAYPTPLEDCNLNIIKTLDRKFDVPIGFSDHTLDPLLAPLIAVSVGANVIEKHFTISKNLEGVDHSFALEPVELKKMVEEIRKMQEVDDKKSYVKKLFGKEKTETVLGSEEKIIPPSEQELYPNDKRSVHAFQNIKIGEKFTKDNISILRSERNLEPGLHPRYFSSLLEKEASRDIPCGRGIKWEDVL